VLYRALGILWIILGIFWLIWPGAARNRLKRKMGRRLKWVVYAFILVFGVVMIGSIFKAPGLVAKIVGIAGLVLTIKVVTLITTKTSEKAFDWLSERPLFVFRIWGAIILAVGIAMLVV
jgi:hypothetical protein